MYRDVDLISTAARHGMFVVVTTATVGAAVELGTQTAPSLICLCSKTHLISNSHVLPRRRPSSAPQYSILEIQPFDYNLKQK